VEPLSQSVHGGKKKKKFPSHPWWELNLNCTDHSPVTTMIELNKRGKLYI